LSIDLHIHSTVSDGTRTPHEILASARRIVLTAIALTDHDTLSGSRELLMTGGSDFHGGLKPEIQLGIGTGDLAVPDALYAKLTEALSAQRPRVAVAQG
jgi:hypothetical protein